MGFVHTLTSSIIGLPILWLVFPLLPFFIVEQLLPVSEALRWRGYAMNKAVRGSLAPRFQGESAN